MHACASLGQVECNETQLIFSHNVLFPTLHRLNIEYTNHFSYLDLECSHNDDQATAVF